MKDAAKKINQLIDTEWSTGEADVFRELALRYKDIAAKEGIRIIPFQSPDLTLFQQASHDERRQAISYLKTIVDIHEETLAGGDKAVNSRRLIWRALSRLSLVPGPDIFEHFSDDDVVLIYQENQTIIFWNLQFFKYTSLTIEQLFFSRWHEFTERAPEIHQKLIGVVMKILSGEITKNFEPGVPGHEVQEINTLENIRTWMEIPFGSVLTKNGSFGGFLIVQTMRIID